MFQFRRFPSYTYEFSIRCMTINHADCSIRKSAAQCVLTTPRSLSQLTTSFFGSWCQGIHPALLFTLPYREWISVLFKNCSILPDSKIIQNFLVALLVVSLICICFFILFSSCSVLVFTKTGVNWWTSSVHICSCSRMVGTNGLEPSTSRLSGVRSNHLSYAPILVEMRRIELLTPCLQSRCSPSWATPPYAFLHLQNWTILQDQQPNLWPLECRAF